MKARAIAFGLVNSLIISLLLAVVMSLAAASLGNHPIQLESFLWSTLQGTIAGVLIGNILPMKKIGDVFCAALGAESKLSRSFVEPIFFATLFAIVLNLYFTAVNTGFGTIMTDFGPVTFMSRFMVNIHVLWAYIYMGAVMLCPVSLFLARKITGFSPAPVEQANVEA